MTWILLTLFQVALAEAPLGTFTPAIVDAQPLVKLKYPRGHREPLFWKRPEVYRKISEERAIPVAVRKDDQKNGEILFTVKGAGIVSVPKSAAVRFAKDYSKLQTISDHFKEVKFDPKDQTLFLRMSALGYEARMILKINWVEEDWRSEMQWEVIWGAFKGMKGQIGFESIDSRKTETSVESLYQAKQLPLPRALMGLALEVITQKVAEKMRTYMEATYKKE